MNSNCRYAPNTASARKSMFWPCTLLMLLVFGPATPGGKDSMPAAARLVDSGYVRLNGNTHPFARAEFDRGEAPLNLRMDRMLLVLKRSAQREKALERLLAEQLDPSSPNFHHWLPPDEFGERFGADPSSIESVSSWLVSRGMTVNRVAAGRGVIEFSGTAKDVEAAFGTTIHNYQLADGEQHWANDRDPRIPAALTPLIAGIDSLHDFGRATASRAVVVSDSARSRRPPHPIGVQFTFSSSLCGRQGNVCRALGPYDLATIYNVLPLWNTGIDGAGQTIAIAIDSNINIQDARDFRRLFGLPAKDPIVIVNGTDPGLLHNAHETEGDLDVEWAGGVAAGATIELVVSPSTNSTSGFDLSSEYIIDKNLASIVSASFSACELFLGTAGNQFYNQLWQQAAAQGITVVIGTGDQGAANCDANLGRPPVPAQTGLTVNGAASTPYNVAVSGTDFNDVGNQSAYWNSTNDPVTQASAKGYIPEFVWNDSCTNAAFGTSSDPETNCNNAQLVGFVRVGGGGGGRSNCTVSDGKNPSSCSGGYQKPTWQTGAGVPNDGVRDVPDVSIFAAGGLASGTFYVGCEADADQDKSSAPCDLNPPFQHFIAGAGDSVALQVFAGVVAIIDQKAGGRQGNINPVLYALAAQQSPASCNSSDPSPTCVFHDVAIGTNSMPCKKGSANCTVTNSSDTYGVLAGYNAGVGYDLVTGLGSVDVTNLVNQGNWTNSSGPDFDMSSPNPVVTIASRATSATMTLTLTSVGGFSGTFNLAAGSCSAMLPGTTCSFSPASVTISPATPSVATTVTVTRSVVTAALQQSPGWRAARTPVPWYAALLGIGIVLLPSGRSRRWQRTYAVVGLSVTLLVVGCGGWPLGTRNAVITATSEGVTHSFVFTVSAN